MQFAESGELSFSRGEVLSILAEVNAPDGWWVAQRGNEQGLVPITCMQPLFGSGNQQRTIADDDASLPRHDEL